MKKVIYTLSIVLILLGFFVVLRSGSSITSASISDTIKCVEPDITPELVNESDCEIISEDTICSQKGLVQIRCQ